MAFSASSFVGKLVELNTSQQSIQSVSLWCIHHRRFAQQIVDVWYQQLLKSPKERKLLFVFLGNDIIQNSKRKGTEFCKEYERVLTGALAHVYSSCDDNKTISQVDRIINIWKERDIFKDEYIQTLRHTRKASDSPMKAHTPDMTPPDDELKSPHKKPRLMSSETAPDPDVVIRALVNLERGSALNDKRVKQQFATIPSEVWNVAAIDKITDRKRLDSLLRSLDTGHENLTKYRTRLQNEFHERNKVAQMLKEFVIHQREQLRNVETRLSEYQNKLAKVQAVRSQLQAHLDSLPDLANLTSAPLEPLPDAGALFDAGGDNG